MMNLFYKTIFTFLLFSSFFSLASASSDGINLNLDVEGTCNSNGICESNEDFFSCPVDCTPIIIPPSGGGSTGGIVVMDNIFNNLTVEVGTNNAVIKWKTIIPVMTNVKWGTSPDYKDGVLKNVNFLMNHKIEINNLKDGTVYYFNIEAVNLLGKTNSLDNQMFRTLSLPDIIPPQNPTNIKATSGVPGITITWTNPTDFDFDYIRVMRNTDRFYGSPFIGRLVYEGKGNYFTDANVKKNNKYYYSLFSRDRIGNYSSGSLVSIKHDFSGAGGSILPEPNGEGETTQNFFVTQDSSVYDLSQGGLLHLNGDREIYIKTKYFERGRDDDMWATIKDIDNQIVGQYFFGRVRDQEGNLSVKIPPLYNAGYYSLTIYRYQGQALRVVSESGIEITGVEVSKTETSSKDIMFVLFFGILLILLLLFIIFVILPRIFKRKKEN